ncbi:MAG: hypothetical protein QOF58_1438 [Pseudonocardiales bacterium]|jgi:hypothetical protein|nr:hypothetical protein [Pseudonocardiales bacterium]
MKDLDRLVHEPEKPVDEGDARFGGPVTPLLVTADCPEDVDEAALGQLIVNAVTVATIPMVAQAALLPDLPADDALRVASRARRTTQPTPGRMLVFAVALHVDPGTTSHQLGGIITAAYEAMAVQVDADHRKPVRMSVLPVEVERFELAWRRATSYFRTQAN